MSRLCDDNFVAMEIAPLTMKGANHRHSGKFSLRSRHRRQRYGFHARHIAQHFLQLE